MVYMPSLSMARTRGAAGMTIKRYDPEAREGLRLGVWDAYMFQNPNGEYVEYSDHCEVVRELVATLRKAVLALAHADSEKPGLYTEAYDCVSAAIEKARGEE